MKHETRKRRAIAVAAGAALMAGAAVMPAAAADYTIKAVFLANTDDEDYDGLMVFKDYVEAQSNGAIEVEIYPGGQLCGNPLECLEALQGGIIEVFQTTFGGFGNMVPEAQVMDLPYIFPSDRVAECALANDTDFYKKVREATLEKTGNIRLMTIGNTGGWRNFATTTKQIKTPADVSGLKIRTISSELQQQLVSAMGGSPTAVSWPEVYTSLATGVIEGTKNGITDIVGMKFNEHLKYITLDGHAYMGALWMLNNDFYQGLPDDLKGIVADGFDALRWTTIVFPKRRSIEAYQAF
ncbi:MAG: TRAP transporter substrate-binding protein DctP, partial [Geminicoccaceae bacterium]|nr:TRAP transporter substrate-binding protein DctP [Geminicoccaceae bacterium]